MAVRVVAKLERCLDRGFAFPRNGAPSTHVSVGVKHLGLNVMFEAYCILTGNLLPRQKPLEKIWLLPFPPWCSLGDRFLDDQRLSFPEVSDEYFVAFSFSLK